MDTTKKWYLSKTVWAGIVTFIIGVYYLAIPCFALFGVNLPPIPQEVLGALALLGIGVVHGRTTATTTIE